MDARVCVLTLYSQPSLNAVCTVWFHESVGNGSWQLTSLLAFVFTRWARVVMILQKKMDLTCHNAELCSLCLDIMSEVWFGSLTWWFFYSAMLDSACLMFTFFFSIFTFPQHQALPWLWSREQGVQRWGPPQAHHGRQRVRVHEPPDGGGRGCLQEAVLPLHQEWRHPRFGKSCLFCKPSVGRWCYDLACVLSSRRLVCLYIMWQPAPKVIFWCVFLYLPLCELIGILAKSFKLWAISH